MDMSNEEKLRVLLAHWIEHNSEHAAEFRRWTDQAGEAEDDIEAAATKVEEANEFLARALDTLGGPLERHTHHHEH